MPHKLPFAVCLTLVVCFLLLTSRSLPTIRAAGREAPPSVVPVPADYREWVYLTSGLDMAYTQPGAAPLPVDHVSVFDNVFVNPPAYRTFLKSGTWPDGTVFVLENRAGERNVSINKAGRTQGEAINGIELHTRQQGDWAFYARQKDGMEHLIARPASCYTCHEAHAAVDTTFVQFYPTLLPVAKAKHVLSSNYLQEASTDTK